MILAQIVLDSSGFLSIFTVHNFKEFFLNKPPTGEKRSKKSFSFPGVI